MSWVVLVWSQGGYVLCGGILVVHRHGVGLVGSAFGSMNFPNRSLGWRELVRVELSGFNVYKDFQGRFPYQEVDLAFRTCLRIQTRERGPGVNNLLQIVSLDWM